MKILLMLSCLMTSFLFSQDIKMESTPLNESKALYSLGVAISRNINNYNFTLNEVEIITKGFSDGLKNQAKETDYDFSSINPYLTKKHQENVNIEKEKAKEYLAKAEKEKGAKKEKSGLIYTIIEKGKGQIPKPEDTVKVHYKGYLIDGKVFDSSYERNQPAEFPLNGVISCWTEGLQKIKTGGKIKLICPSDIAYGDMGRPPVIPGGATLIFEVELLDIVKREPPKEQTK